MLQRELTAIVKAGRYPSEQDVIRHALEVLLVANAQLRVETALELYQGGYVTLSRAAEIAGLSFGKWKDTLAERGIPIRMETSPAEIFEGASLITQLRGRL